MIQLSNTSKSLHNIIINDRRFDLLPILGDALGDQGHPNADKIRSLDIGYLAKKVSKSRQNGKTKPEGTFLIPYDINIINDLPSPREDCGDNVLELARAALDRGTSANFTWRYPYRRRGHHWHRYEVEPISIVYEICCSRRHCEVLLRAFLNGKDVPGDVISIVYNELNALIFEGEVSCMTLTQQNPLRQDLSPIDLAKAYQSALLAGNLSVGDLSMAVDRSEKTIQRHLRLLKLPKKTQQRIHKGELSMTQALKGCK